jgi:hypothetical protein
MVASATLALKAGVWFRRGRLFIVSLDSLAQRARSAETPLIVLFRFLKPALGFSSHTRVIGLSYIKAYTIDVDEYDHEWKPVNAAAKKSK